VKTIYVEQGATPAVVSRAPKAAVTASAKPTCHVRGRWQLRQDYGTKSTQQAFACPLAATGQPLVRKQIFAGMLAEDIKVREYLKAKLKSAAVSRVLIESRQERTHHDFLGSSGVVIAKGEDIEKPQERTESSACARRQHRRSAQA
jgi:hypothetical protein